jgi:hypothetical protein
MMQQHCQPAGACPISSARRPSYQPQYVLVCQTLLPSTAIPVWAAAWAAGHPINRPGPESGATSVTSGRMGGCIARAGPCSSAGRLLPILGFLCCFLPAHYSPHLGAPMPGAPSSFGPWAAAAVPPESLGWWLLCPCTRPTALPTAGPCGRPGRHTAAAKHTKPQSVLL